MSQKYENLNKHLKETLAEVIISLSFPDLPAMHGTRVWSLGQEDPLEKGMATHSNTLAWKIPWTEEPGGL